MSHCLVLSTPLTTPNPRRQRKEKENKTERQWAASYTCNTACMHARDPPLRPTYPASQRAVRRSVAQSETTTSCNPGYKARDKETVSARHSPTNTQESVSETHPKTRKKKKQERRRRQPSFSMRCRPRSCDAWETLFAQSSLTSGADHQPHHEFRYSTSWRGLGRSAAATAGAREAFPRAATKSCDGTDGPETDRQRRSGTSTASNSQIHGRTGAGERVRSASQRPGPSGTAPRRHTGAEVRAREGSWPGMAWLGWLSSVSGDSRLKGALKHTAINQNNMPRSKGGEIGAGDQAAVTASSRTELVRVAQTHAVWLPTTCICRAAREAHMPARQLSHDEAHLVSDSAGPMATPARACSPPETSLAAWLRTRPCVADFWKLETARLDRLV